MDKQFISTTEKPVVVLEVHGDLHLKGHDELQVSVKSSSPEELTIREQEGAVHIQCTTDSFVRVPRRADVRVRVVDGNAVLKGLEGGLTIDAVHGDLDLRGVGDTALQVVHGNLVAKNISGDLSIDNIMGNVTVRDLQGNLNISGRISGNLNLNDIDGGATAKADGNISLRLDPSPGQSYTFNASGDLACRLPDDASAEINVTQASRVMVNLAEAITSAPIKTPYTMTLGDGDATLTLSAEGSVILQRYSPNWDDFGAIDVEIGQEVEGMSEAISQQIGAQVEAQIQMMEQQLEAQMSVLSMRLGAARLNEDQARRIESRAREASERARKRAQERIRRAQERLEQKMSATQRKIEIKARAAERASSHHSHHGWGGFIPHIQSTPPISQVEPVSEEERLMILRMLEQKKISLDEAEKLLAALEEKEG